MDVNHFSVEDQPAAHDLEFVEDQINRYNMAQVGAFDGRDLAIFVRNEQQEIVAGLTAYTWAGMCEIKFLWVQPELRAQGYGGRLLEAAEQEARARGCSIVILGTYSFQAPAFYQKRGYAMVGSIDDCPPGHTNYYLKKML
jgi:GNAT superfamily N-acetyltransferase